MNRRRLEALERLLVVESAQKGTTTILTEEERLSALTRLYALFGHENGFTIERSPVTIWQWAHEHALRQMASARASGSP